MNLWAGSSWVFTNRKIKEVGFDVVYHVADYVPSGVEAINKNFATKISIRRA